MNAYTTRGQARIQPSDLSAVLRANGLAGAALAGLEWQRECQAAAELDWRLTQSTATPHAGLPRVALLRQAIWAALVRVGERLSRDHTSVTRQSPSCVCC